MVAAVLLLPLLLPLLLRLLLLPLSLLPLVVVEPLLSTALANAAARYYCYRYRRCCRSYFCCCFRYSY